MTYPEYKQAFEQTTAEDAEINGTTEENERTDRFLNTLREFDQIPETTRIYNSTGKGPGQRNTRLDGFAFDDADHSLLLFVSDLNDHAGIQKLTMTQIDELYWKIYYLLDTALSDKADTYLAPGSDLAKAGHFIRHGMNALADAPDQVLKLRFVILTNREVDLKVVNKGLFTSGSTKAKATEKNKTGKKIKKDEYKGKKLEIELWTLERLYELETANRIEPIDINFSEDFGVDGIPCLKGDIGDNLDYEAYICIIPGKLLADIYIEYGSRILEGNVRAFLGTNSAKGVNSGIKRTINNDPTRFFTYNNGIAATASDLTLDTVDGERMITGVTDLQIINGGQTTATLAEAVLKKTNPDLSGIYVPMKLTVIRDRETETEDGILIYDQMIHDIAKYANSQNKVTAADLFSNDPFHVWMEKASKKIMAPTIKFPIPTGWYYERARKKYIQEQIKLTGEAQKRFLARFPKKQIISKEQLAIYLTAAECKPHIVSRGKNWVMKEFGTSIGQAYRKDKSSFNEYFFKKCVAQAILYRTVDEYLETNKKNPDFWYKPGGYKLNIVPYTIAKLVSSVPQGYSIDWADIWKRQGIPSAMQREIAVLTKMANDFFCSNHGLLVTEFCKKETTWSSFRDNIPYQPNDAFRAILIPLAEEKKAQESAREEQKERNDLTVAMKIIQAGESYWLSCLNTGRQLNILNNQECVYLEQAAKLAKSGNIPCTTSGRVPWKTMAIVDGALVARDKLTAEGVVINDQGISVHLTLSNYDLH